MGTCIDESNLMQMYGSFDGFPCCIVPCWGFRVMFHDPSQNSGKSSHFFFENPCLGVRKVSNIKQNHLNKSRIIRRRKKDRTEEIALFKKAIVISLPFFLHTLYRILCYAESKKAPSGVSEAKKSRHSPNG